MGVIRGRVMTGARARVLINGQKVGWATGVQVREVFDNRRVKVLDKIEAASFEPVDYSVTFTLQTLTIVGTTLKGAGLFPSGGEEEGSRLKNALALADFSLMIEDSVTNTPIALVLGAKFNTQSLNFDSGNFSATNIDGVGIELKDASEI